MRFLKDKLGLDVLEYVAIGAVVLAGGSVAYAALTGGVQTTANSIRTFITGLQFTSP